MFIFISAVSFRISRLQCVIKFGVICTWCRFLDLGGPYWMIKILQNVQTGWCTYISAMAWTDICSAVLSRILWRLSYYPFIVAKRFLILAMVQWSILFGATLMVYQNSTMADLLSWFIVLMNFKWNFKSKIFLWLIPTNITSSPWNNMTLISDEHVKFQFKLWMILSESILGSFMK